MENPTQTFTLTFGDQGENHKGMQKIGEMSDHGFSLSDLRNAKRFFQEHSVEVEIYHLNKLLVGVNLGEGEAPVNAYVLVARDAVSAILDDGDVDLEEAGSFRVDALYEEQDALEKDTKAYMYGRVVDKKARHNLCFGVKGQEPDYEAGKGRIVAFEDVPLLENIRGKLEEIMPGEACSKMICEGNYYYDAVGQEGKPALCYIGFHGDSERRKVIGVRLGASFKFHYQWYGLPEYDEEATKKAKKKNNKARDRYVKKMLGKRLEITLNHGDLYIMSEKAVGTDWMSKKVITLRHAAGDAKCPGLKGINSEFTTGKSLLWAPKKAVTKKK